MIEAAADSPSMQEKWEPEPVKLIWDLRVEERQQSTDIIHAVHLKRDEGKILFRLFLNLFCDLEDVHRSHCPFCSAKMSKDTERVPYLRAESGLFMKVAVHEVTILSGCDFTPWQKQAEPTGYMSWIGLIHRFTASTDMLLSHLPLVPMQQGRPVMVQSMWGRLVWFPVLYLVQI